MAQMVLGHVFPLPANRDELPEGVPICREVPDGEDVFNFDERLDLRDFARTMVRRMKSDLARKEGKTK